MFQRFFRSTSLPAGRAGTWSRAVAGAILLSALSIPAAAQSGSGVAAIEGTVIDPDNAVIGGALVIIVSTETGYDRSTYTDSSGRYFVSAMPVSTYLIAVSAKGFAHTRREGVHLAVGATETVNFTLKIAEFAETVTVSAARPLLANAETGPGVPVWRSRTESAQGAVCGAVRCAGARRHGAGRFAGASGRAARDEP